MQSKPLVSILICTYNSEPHIEATLQSVLDQTYENTEIRVLDNNSEDRTGEILQEYETEYNEFHVTELDYNSGPYQGVNLLIDEAGGEYIAIQDHDDIWHPQKLELQLEFLENNTGYVGCGSSSIVYFEDTKEIAISDRPEVGYYAPHPTLVFRNNGYKYDTELLYKADMYFMRYILCENEKRIYNIQRPLLLHRIHSDRSNLSITWNKPKEIKEYYLKTKNKKQLAHYLARRFLPDYFVQYIWKKVVREEGQMPVTDLSRSSFNKEFLRYIEHV